MNKYIFSALVIVTYKDNTTKTFLEHSTYISTYYDFNEAAELHERGMYYEDVNNEILCIALLDASKIKVSTLCNAIGKSTLMASYYGA